MSAPTGLQHHLQKTLVAGAKKAQTFETQRLIKKIAQLKSVETSLLHVELDTCDGLPPTWTPDDPREVS